MEVKVGMTGVAQGVISTVPGLRAIPVWPTQGSVKASGSVGALERTVAEKVISVGLT